MTEEIPIQDGCLAPEIVLSSFKFCIFAPRWPFLTFLQRRRER